MCLNKYQIDLALHNTNTEEHRKEKQFHKFILFLMWFVQCRGERINLSHRRCKNQIAHRFLKISIAKFCLKGVWTENYLAPPTLAKLVDIQWFNTPKDLVPRRDACRGGTRGRQPRSGWWPQPAETRHRFPRRRLRRSSASLIKPV